LLAKAAGDENNPQLDQQNMEKQKLDKKLWMTAWNEFTLW
jgi:hypothetical protein